MFSHDHHLNVSPICIKVNSHTWVKHINREENSVFSLETNIILHYGRFISRSNHTPVSKTYKRRGTSVKLEINWQILSLRFNRSSVKHRCDTIECSNLENQLQHCFHPNQPSLANGELHWLLWAVGFQPRAKGPSAKCKTENDHNGSISISSPLLMLEPQNLFHRGMASLWSYYNL